MSGGRFVKLLEPGSWRESRSLEHSEPVKEVYFSPDGRRLSVKTAGEYRRAIERNFHRRERAFVWDVGSGLVACGTIEDKYSADVSMSERGVAESVPCPDVRGHAQEKLLAGALGWEKVLPGGDKPSSPDGRWIISPDDGGPGTVLAFKEGNAERKVATLTGRWSVRCWAFTPDSRWLLVSDYWSVKLWPLKQADLIAETCARLRLRDLPAEVWRKYFSGEMSEPTCVPCSVSGRR